MFEGTPALRSESPYVLGSMRYSLVNILRATKQSKHYHDILQTEESASWRFTVINLIGVGAVWLGPQVPDSVFPAFWPFCFQDGRTLVHLDLPLASHWSRHLSFTSVLLHLPHVLAPHCPLKPVCGWWPDTCWKILRSPSLQISRPFFRLLVSGPSSFLISLRMSHLS